jgi:hypothetical protein
VEPSSHQNEEDFTYGNGTGYDQSAPYDPPAAAAPYPPVPYPAARENPFGDNAQPGDDQPPRQENPFTDSAAGYQPPAPPPGDAAAAPTPYK